MLLAKPIFGLPRFFFTVRLRAASLVLISLLFACRADPPAGSSSPITDPVPGAGVGGGQTDAAADLEDEKARRAASEARVKALRETLKSAPADALWETGTSALEKQNHKDARDAFRALVLHHPEDERAPVAAHSAAQASFRLSKYDEGLDWMDDAILITEGTPAEARLNRVLGNLYLAVPHYGTRRGGEFHRARYDQGIYEYSYRRDRKRAIRHLEKARELLATIEKVPIDERIETQFELVGAVARFTPYDGAWHHWYYPWGEAGDDDLVDEEGADENVDRWWRQGMLQRARPRGMPVDAHGNIIFVARPEAYDVGLSDTGKLKFLLHEVTELDTSEAKERAAQALFRQAMFFRARDGTQRLQRLTNWWWEGQRPYQKDIEGAKLWELEENEVFGLIATHIGVYEVPADENPLRLFDQIIETYPKSKVADDARYYRGVFHQSRQQYEKAIAEFEAYLKTQPEGAHHGWAEHSLRTIRQAEIKLDSSSAQPAGRAASISVDHRNIETVHAKAVRVDLSRVIRDMKRNWGRRDANLQLPYALNNPVNFLLHSRDDEQLKKYQKGAWRNFSFNLKTDPSHRYARSDVTVPLSEQGLWVLIAYEDEARTRELSRSLLMLESTAVVNKAAKDGELFWIVDALTGVPVAHASVEVFEFWSVWDDNKHQAKKKTFTRKADAQGLLLLPPRSNHQRFFTIRHGERLSYSGDNFYWAYHPAGQRQTDRALVFTDRPVYRPDHRVKLQVWGRQRGEAGYREASEVQNIQIKINDPKGGTVLNATQAAVDGAATFEYVVPEAAPLGMYRVEVRVDGRWTQVGGGQFRVEEYKAPEFEVVVEAGDGPAKLGEKIPVQIRADYFFGGAVENARVRYKVFRTDYEHDYVAPAPYDWLYGAGYGRCYYAYPWFSWWGEWGWHPWRWSPWWGARPEPVRELVREGEGRLDHDGQLRFELDTRRAKEQYGDEDQKFIIKAEVTDASRRTITGEGDVLATRRQFFVHTETDQGYYQTGNTIRLQVRSLLPSNAPIATSGKLRVARVAFRGDDLKTLEEKPVFEEAARTDADGRLEARWDAKEPGQYRLSYVTRDAWGEEVVGTTLVWVWGPNFDGRHYRFNHLEVITDKRTYDVGETARVLISTDVAGAHVLFSPKVDRGFLLESRVIALERKTKVIEIPITAAHVPNFFIEATLVAEGKLSEEVRELFVPPEDAELLVSVRPKSKRFKAGKPAELEVLTTTPDGQPVPATVAVSVYDKSVTYIQPSLTPQARAFFWGEKRSHNKITASNLKRRYATWQSLQRPDLQASNQLGSLTYSWMQQQVNLRGATGKGEAVGGVASLGAKLDLASADEPAAEAEEMASSSAKPSGALERKKESSRSRDRSLGDARRQDTPDDAVGGRRENNKRAGAEALKQPEVRRNFADTATFQAVRTNAEGRATLEWTFPDNLTTWNVRAIGLTNTTQVGEDATSVITTKDLLVRLQAPRFFREKDRVMISANVHNRLQSDKSVTVRLSVPEGLLVLDGDAERKVQVKQGGEARVDWWVDVRGEGEATVRVSALTDEESDAKEMTFPVLVHGFMKTVSKVGSIDASGTEAKIALSVPKERRPELTKLTLRWSPSLAGAMIDALPYLLVYPYGCTEQTMSRFMPAAITRRALQLSGVRLEDLDALKKSLNPQHLDGSDAQAAARKKRMYQRYARNPVYDSEQMQAMIQAGLRRIRKMRRPDGGWGWWGSDRSSVYTTAYVLWGLWEAQQSEVRVDSDLIQRGRQALRSLVQVELAYYETHKQWVNNSHAYFAFVMSLWGEKNDALNKILIDRRSQLTPYGQSLLAMALYGTGDKRNAKLLLQNASQHLEEDAENQTAWLDTRKDGWWYWWNSDIETNATFLRALVMIHPEDARAPGIVKWLLNHRKNGYYWNSTRDTAVTVAAFAQYMRASGEQQTDYDLEVLWDGKVVKTVHISKENLLMYDGQLVLEGVEVDGGDHELVLRKKGKGAVYFNAYLEYFSREEEDEAGLEVKVHRQYFKLVREDRKHEVYDKNGRATELKEAAYRKVALETGDEVKSGDLILVELMIESKNDYSFLAFEDPKPAGAEPVALRSGKTYGEAVANLELRDEKVVFFLRQLNQGKLRLEYRLRAEIPGTFNAMPTQGFAMYAPEIRANSAHMRLGIVDAPE